MISIMEQATAKLQGELKAVNQPFMENPIVDYIGKNLDESLAECIVLEHKSLAKCISYINQEARKKLGGKNGGLPDQDVYDMAVAYFRLDDAEEERIKAEVAAKRAEEAKERQRKAKAEKEAKQAEKQPNQKPKPDQLSLFDGLEGANA